MRLKNNPGCAPDRLTEAGDRLTRLYELWGQPEKAQRWREELRSEDGLSEHP